MLISKTYLIPQKILLLQHRANVAAGHRPDAVSRYTKELFARAEQEDNPDISDRTLEKARSKPLRAPVVIAIVASVTPNHKVPRIEQVHPAERFARSP